MNNLASPNQEPIKPASKIYIINPSVEEFTTTYLDNNNVQHEVTLEPLEHREFPKGVGEVVLSHLVDFLINKNGFSYKTDINLEKAKLRKECTIYE